MIVNTESKIVEKNEFDFDINLLFSKLEAQEIQDVFSLICDTEGLIGTYRRTISHIFNTTYNILHFLHKNEEISKIDLNMIKEQLTLNSLIKFYKSRRDLPSSTHKDLKKIFAYLEDFDLEAQKQTTSVYEEFNIYSTGIFYLLENVSFSKLYVLEGMQKILGQLSNPIEKTEEEALISNFFKHSIKNNQLKTYEEKEIIDFIRGEKEVSDNKIYSSMIEFYLYKKDKKELFNSIDCYIDFYAKNHHKNKLIMNEKIEIFSTTYYINEYDRYINESLISLICRYDSSLLIDVFNHYALPYNIPFNLIVNEGNIESQSLLSYLLETNIALLSSILEINDTILDSITCSINIQKKNYQCHFDIKEDLTYDNTIKLAYHSQKIRKQLDLKRLLVKNDYVDFIQLYELIEEQEENFALPEPKSIFKVYLNTLPDMKNIHNDMLDIFKKEKVILTVEDFSIFDSLYANLKEDNDEKEAQQYILNITKQLLPLFSDDLKALLLKEEPVIKIPVLEIKEIDNYIHWYNPDVILKSLKNSKGSKNKVLNELLLSNSFKKPTLRIEDESFFAQLEEDVPHFKEIIDYYKGQFRQNYYSNKYHITPILLLGEPGIGKTYFAKQLASYLNTGYSFVDMASMTSSWILSGNNGTWQDSKQGKIFEAMLTSQTVNPIILMDEIDKVSGGKYDPLGPLYQLLEEVNAKEFTDEFLDISFNAAGIIYIACANSINTLSEPLLSRFKVFNVPSPNEEQLDKIIKNIYRVALNDNPLMSKELNVEVIQYLKSNSLRESKVMIEEAISNLMLSKSREELNTLKLANKQLSLSLENFKDKKVKTKLGFSRNQ